MNTDGKEKGSSSSSSSSSSSNGSDKSSANDLASKLMASLEAFNGRMATVETACNQLARKRTYASTVHEAAAKHIAAVKAYLACSFDPSDIAVALGQSRERECVVPR